MADTVVVKRTENRLIVTKQDPKAVIAAPYVKNINQYAYSLTVLGYYENLSALVAGVSTPDVGDVYGVGTSAPYTIYIWDGTSWVDNGTIKGDKGDPTEWLRGTVDPNTEGADGDLYLNYTTWHVWEKISGTWTDRGSIKGADGSGSGDVTGPSSSVDGNLAAFDGVTGKLIKDSGVKPSDFADTSHSHNDLYYTESEMDTKLSEKANTSHSHSYAPIPTSSSLPVGAWCLCYNKATSDIANGGTIAGSNLKIFGLKLTSTSGATSSNNAYALEGGSLSGTWKNITGTKVGKYESSTSGGTTTITRNCGLFVRTA